MGVDEHDDTQRRRSFRRRAEGALRRLRYYAVVAASPHLAGEALSLGPRVSVRASRSARFRRGRRCVVAGDFHGVLEGTMRWGDDVYFNVGAYVCCFEEVTIGSRCRFGERVSIHDEDHVVHRSEGRGAGYLTSPVTIGDDVWVGANAVILRGSRLGDGCVVAAGAVVRGEVPAGTLVAGVPARVVKEVAR